MSPRAAEAQLSLTRGKYSRMFSRETTAANCTPKAQGLGPRPCVVVQSGIQEEEEAG